MSIQKIKESELSSLGVSALPTRPSFPSLYEGRSLSASELRAAFDRLPRLIAERFNALLESFGLADGERETLAEAIATELFEGHSLADLFRDIESGALLSYLKNENGESLSSCLLSLASPMGEVREGETGGVSGAAVAERLSEEKARIIGEASGLYRLAHVAGNAMTLCLEVLRDGAWVTAGEIFSLPKDAFLKSGTVKTVTEDGIPEAGYAKGEKYLDLIIGGETESHIYVKVSDLVDSVSVAHTGKGDIVTSLSSDGSTVTVERSLSSSLFATKDDLVALDESYVKKEGLASLIRKSALLEQAAAGHAFTYESDTASAYIKKVPKESTSYALLSRIGGRSVGGNLFDVSMLTVGTPNGFSITYDEQEECFILNGTLDGVNNYALCDLLTPIAASGKTFSFSYLPVGGSFTAEDATVICAFGSGRDSIGMPMDTYGYTELSSGKAVTVEGEVYHSTEHATGALDSFIFFLLPSDTDLSAYSITFHHYRLKIMVNEGETAKEHAPFRLSHSPVTAIRTVGKNLLPETVYDLDHWKTEKSNKVFDFELAEEGIYAVSCNRSAEFKNYLYVHISTDDGETYSAADAALNKSSSPNYTGKPTYGYFLTPTALDSPLYIEHKKGRKWRLWLHEAKQSDMDVISDFQIERCEFLAAPSAYTPYTETVYPIPEAVKSLDGYGYGISDTVYNYLDLENGLFVRRVGERAYMEGDREDESLLTDGERTLYPLEAEETEDVSAYLPDGFLTVEGKGTLFFENAKQRAVPSEMTYQLKLKEGENA